MNYYTKYVTYIYTIIYKIIYYIEYKNKNNFIIIIYPTSIKIEKLVILHEKMKGTINSFLQEKIFLSIRDFIF